MEDATMPGLIIRVTMAHAQNVIARNIQPSVYRGGKYCFKPKKRKENMDFGMGGI